jgi:signal transduction histidine kinase
MPRRNHRKRALLFLAAVLLPSAVLVGTTARLIRQERELAVRRMEEERALLALRMGQELLEDLRRLGERVAGVSLTPPGIYTLSDSEPAILTLASVRSGRLVFPWEASSDPFSALEPRRLTRYSRLLNQGEQAEYRAGNFVEAASFYGQAAEVMEEGDGGDDSRAAVEEEIPLAADILLAEARVQLARALLRAERTEEARAVHLLLAETPSFLADADGMPFSLYGWEGLRQSGAEPDSLLPLLEKTLDSPTQFALPALLAWKDIAQKIAGAVGDESTMRLLQAVEEAVASRASTLEDLESLRTDFPALLGTARGGRESSAPHGTPSWIPYGSEPWLVGVPAGVEEAPTPVVIVRPGVLLGSPAGPGVSEVRTGTGEAETGDETFRAAWQEMTLLPVGDAGGESMGPALNGLRASFPPGFPPLREGGGVEGWFFRLFLPLILLLTGFTAYLAWRDVRRETEAVRLRSQFVSSVTHELKTPLTSIRMFAETLRLGRHSGPESQQEYLDTVVHETERLSRLINNVLDFARIDRGDKTYHMAPTDVGAAAREAARVLAYPLAQGGYTLTTEIAEDLPMVEADGDALTQALLNLLSNAIKFSGEGSRIDLRVFREGEDVLVQVEDRGRGIAPRDQETIFQDFYRTADAEREGIPGTGLGLPLVAHVAEAHSGRVEVSSEVGRGSTFTLRIPADGGWKKAAGEGPAGGSSASTPESGEGGGP